MIEKIYPDRISFTLPTVFGEELTFLEFLGKIKVKLNECIDAVNASDEKLDGFAEELATYSARFAKIESAIAKNGADIESNKSAIEATNKSVADLATAVNAEIEKLKKSTTDNATEISVLKSLASELQDNIDALTAKVEKLYARLQAAKNILFVHDRDEWGNTKFSIYQKILSTSPYSSEDGGSFYAHTKFNFSGLSQTSDEGKVSIESFDFGQLVFSASVSSPAYIKKSQTFEIPVTFNASSDIPVGSQQISVTGVDFDLLATDYNFASAYLINNIPTGFFIPCENLRLAAPADEQSEPKIFYSFFAKEDASLTILATAAGVGAITERPTLDFDFTKIISSPDEMIGQFLTSNGFFTNSSVSSITAGGASFGSAMLFDHTLTPVASTTCGARVTIAPVGNTQVLLLPTGKALSRLPYGSCYEVKIFFDFVGGD